MRYVTGAILLSLICSGCAPVQRPQPAQPVARAFTYTPPEEPRRQLPATIALVRPTYAEATRARLTNGPVWARSTTEAFAGSLRSDLEKILIAKGFKVTGPYDKLDLMTFPEKTGANLTLTPVVELTLDARVARRTAPTTLLYGTEEGVLLVGGWISLVMLEPMTGEKMWIKRVEVEAAQEPYSMTSILVVRDGQRIQSIRSDSRPDALTSALNRIYPKVMQTTWTYFHPDEVMITKQQAEELRARKRY